MKLKKESAKPLCSLWFGFLPTLPFKQEILKEKGVLCEATLRLCLFSFSQNLASGHLELLEADQTD